MSQTYYFATQKCDYIINFCTHRIDKVPKGEDLAMFNPKEMFPLFSSSVWNKRGIMALSRDELVDDVFHDACLYHLKHKDFKMLCKTIGYWNKERAAT